MCVARHAPITQNNKFDISLQHVNKEVSDVVDFLLADKHESLLQIDINIFWWWRSSTPKVPKIASSQCLYNISKKKLEKKLNFWMQINIKVSYKLISTLWGSQFPTRWYYHYGWAWSIILKVLEVTSLQYLYNNSKKKLGMGLIFCTQIKLLQVGLSFLMKVARHVQSTQNKKFVRFLKCIKKKYHNCFCVLLWNKTCRYFTSVPVMFAVTCFWVFVVKNGHGLLDHGTLNSVVSQEGIDEMSWFYCMLI